MNTIKNEAVLQTELAAIDLEIKKLNDQKITLFIEAIGLSELAPKDYLKWETILIVVPDRHISHELKQYKFAISRIALATNINAKQLHIYDLEEWQKAFRNKTQLQIRRLLKTSFGGVQKLPEEYKKENNK